MSRINIDQCFFGDERFDQLSNILAEPRMMIDGRMLRLWNSCYRDVSDIRTPQQIQRAMCLVKEDLPEILVRCDLAEKCDSEYRIKGVAKRIEYLIQAKENGRLGGKKSVTIRKQKYGSAVPINASNNPKNPKGSFEAPSASSEVVTSAPPKPLPLPLPPSQIKNTISSNCDQISTNSNMPGLASGGAVCPDLLAIWNENCAELPTAQTISKKRKTAWVQRWRENPDRDYWIGIVKRIASSDFCCGRSASGWKATVDFLLRQDTHIKVSEGTYDRKTQVKSTLSKMVFSREEHA